MVVEAWPAINSDGASGLAASVGGGEAGVVGKNTGKELLPHRQYGGLVNELASRLPRMWLPPRQIASVTVTSATNTFTNAVSGITLTAVSPTALGQTETLTVNSDQSTAVNAVKDVAKFNDIINRSRPTQYDETKRAARCSPSLRVNLTAHPQPHRRVRGHGPERRAAERFRRGPAGQRDAP
jgi:hypothetical protein